MPPGITLGFLGWFVSAWVFMAAATAVLVVIAVRQFGAAFRHLLGEPASQDLLPRAEFRR